MNIKVLGKGFVSDHLSYDKITNRLDLSKQQIDSIIDNYKPDVLINCVAKTGVGNTDWCENNKEITYKTNALFPILLAEQCQKHSIHLIHIGTGSIFNGQSPNVFTNDLGWKESDLANPQSFYEKTKYSADLILSEYKCSIFRIKLPISHIHHPKNLITKLISYNKIIDEINSFTFLEDFSNWIDYYLSNNIAQGIYHVINPGEITNIDIIKEYQKYFPEHFFQIINQDDLDKLTIAKRSNSILNIEKLLNTGFKIRPVKTALEETMLKYIGD